MKISGFLRPQLPLYIAVLLSASMGLLAPFAMAGLRPFLSPADRQVAFAAVGVCGVALIWLLWRSSVKGDWRPDRSPTFGAVAAAALFALGVAGSVWCFEAHVGKGGHMGHSPHPPWHYVVDGGWATCLAASAYCYARLGSRVAVGVAALGAFLVCYRFLFGSFHGIYPIPL